MKLRYIGKHRPKSVTPVPFEEALSRHVNAVDSTGTRYTTHNFAQREDWWFGAVILTPQVIDNLKHAGTHLREVHVPVRTRND